MDCNDCFHCDRFPELYPCNKCLHDEFWKANKMKIACETCKYDLEETIMFASICRNCVESNIPHKNWEAKDEN